LSVLLVAAGLNFLIAPRGLRDLLVLQHHRARLEAERERQLADNRSLQSTLENLQSNDAYLQRLIRKELGYARPNELIYRFSTDAGAAAAEAP